MCESTTQGPALGSTALRTVASGKTHDPETLHQKYTKPTKELGIVHMDRLKKKHSFYKINRHKEVHNHDREILYSIPKSQS